MPKRSIGGRQARDMRMHLRVNENEWQRLKELAQAYDASVSGLVRWLVKQEHDAMRERAMALEGLDGRDQAVIAALRERPQDEEEIVFRLSRFGQPLDEITKWLGERLEWLRALGYAEKSLDGEYLLTARGVAAREGLVESVPEDRRGSLAAYLAEAFDEAQR